MVPRPMDGNSSPRGRHRHRATPGNTVPVDGSPQWTPSTDRPQWTPPPVAPQWTPPQPAPEWTGVPGPRARSTEQAAFQWTQPGAAPARTDEPPARVRSTEPAVPVDPAGAAPARTDERPARAWSTEQPAFQWTRPSAAPSGPVSQGPATGAPSSSSGPRGPSRARRPVSRPRATGPPSRRLQRRRPPAPTGRGVRHPVRLALYALVLFGLLAGSAAWLVGGQVRPAHRGRRGPGGLHVRQHGRRRPGRRRPHRVAPGRARPRRGGPHLRRRGDRAAPRPAAPDDDRRQAARGLGHRDHRAGGAGPGRLPAVRALRVRDPVGAAAAGGLRAHRPHPQDRHGAGRRPPPAGGHHGGDRRRDPRARPGSRSTATTRSPSSPPPRWSPA